MYRQTKKDTKLSLFTRIYGFFIILKAEEITITKKNGENNYIKSGFDFIMNFFTLKISQKTFKKKRDNYESRLL